ncbi:MAG: sodium:solute symporter family transporter [Draconibacterium sp.]
MSILDWIILGIFALALVGIIFWVLKQKEKDTSDYFLAGRDATWIAIGASIFASNIGSEHLVGLAGAGAESGMAMAHWEMHGWMILMLGWLFVTLSKHLDKVAEILSNKKICCVLVVTSTTAGSIKIIQA